MDNTTPLNTRGQQQRNPPPPPPSPRGPLPSAACMRTHTTVPAHHAAPPLPPAAPCPSPGAHRTHGSHHGGTHAPSPCHSSRIDLHDGRNNTGSRRFGSKSSSVKRCSAVRPWAARSCPASRPCAVRSCPTARARAFQRGGALAGRERVRQRPPVAGHAGEHRLSLDQLRRGPPPAALSAASWSPGTARVAPASAL